MKYFLIVLFVCIPALAFDVNDTKDIENLESKKSMEKWFEAGFGLKPYKVNYLLPYGHGDEEYNSYDSTEYKNIEAEQPCRQQEQPGTLLHCPFHDPALPAPHRVPGKEL